MRKVPLCLGRILGFSDNNTIYVGNKHVLLEVDNEKGKAIARKKVPAAFCKQLFSASRLWCRLMRHEIRAFGVLPDAGLIAATKNGIYYADSDEPIMKAARLPSLSRRIHLPITLTIDSKSRVLWGEYWPNPQREPVHVFASFDRGCSYESIKEFSKGQVRHIHGIWQDRFNNGFWVMTGDEDSESGIGWLSDDFRDFEWLVKGNQQYRAVVVFVLQDHLIYATDTEKDYNHIYRLDKNTAKTEKLAEIPGSCMYGCKFGKWYVISTTVERFHKFKTSLATLWVSRDGLKWQQVWQVQKDILPKKYFQYGSIVLPRQGCERNQIVFSGQALKQIDNKVCVARIVEQ